jgi:hypothetical protein
MTDFELPDFEEMLGLADRIGALRREIDVYEASLDAKLAEITRVVTQNKEYWHTGKAPAVNYIKTVFHSEGHTEQAGKELSGLRKNIFAKTGELETLKLKFQIYKSMVDVWKANQYNKNQANY